MRSSSVIAIIPARQGSKGVPRKNLMQLAGRPLVSWMINAAVEALGCENVVVSSDGDEIVEVAKKHDVMTHRRSAETSSDTASSESALIEAIRHLNALGRESSNVLFLQCTSPLVQCSDLLGLIELHKEKNLDSAFTACLSHSFLWAKKTDNATGINHDKNIRLRRQDMEPQYRENGAAYIMKTDGFMERGHRFFGRTGIFEMPENRSWEIDSLADFAFVGSLLNQRNNSAADMSETKAIVFDFDGVLTDNAVFVSENGVEGVRCDRGDGYGFELARKAGLRLLILSKEQNKVVSARAKKLQCEVIQGVDEKPVVLTDWLEMQSLSWGDIAYVGNDLNDLECIRRAGIGVAVADAVEPVKREADLVLKKRGGHGAARELIEATIDAVTRN